MTLPAIDEINSSTNILSEPDAATKVVKVNEQFAVRLGRGVSSLEAEITVFISSNTSIPMSKVFAAFTGPQMKMTFTVMEFIRAAMLEALLPMLSAIEKSDVCCHVMDAVYELQKLPLPDYF